MNIKRLSYAAKEKIISLAGACFWYWNGFYSFLKSCGVPEDLYLRYPRESHNKYQIMRNVLDDLEKSNNLDTINSIISEFYRLKKPVDRDKLDEEKAKQLLNEFRDIVGDDPIETAIKKKEQRKARDNYQELLSTRQTQSNRLQELNSAFLKLATSSEVSPQKRGFQLEALFFDLLHFCEMEHTKPYRTSQGEQIDGHFRYEKFDYLVEAKWTKELTKQEELSIFDGKIKGKAQSTRGLFLSASDFDDHAIQKFSGDAPRIVLMTGEDIALILCGQILLADALKAKVDAIVRHGKICFRLRDLGKGRML